MCFLRQVELVGEPPIGERFFDRVQILALDVFDQRHLEQRLLVAGRRRARRPAPQQAGALRGAPAAFAGDDLIAVADACARRSAG